MPVFSGTVSAPRGSVRRRPSASAHTLVVRSVEKAGACLSHPLQREEFPRHGKWVHMLGRPKEELFTKTAFTDLSRLAGCSQV